MLSLGSCISETKLMFVHHSYQSDISKEMWDSADLLDFEP